MSSVNPSPPKERSRIAIAGWGVVAGWAVAEIWWRWLPVGIVDIWTIDNRPAYFGFASMCAMTGSVVGLVLSSLPRSKWPLALGIGLTVVWMTWRRARWEYCVETLHGNLTEIAGLPWQLLISSLPGFVAFAAIVWLAQAASRMRLPKRAIDQAP